MDKKAMLKRKLELKRLQYRRAAQDRLAIFLNYTMPSYQRQWFHTLIADKCQALLEGKIQKLMIFVPPQHGKSEIVSRRFPAWAFGRDPSLKIVECSYSSTLAESFSRSIQLTMDSKEYQELFPDTQIPKRGGGGLKRDVDYFDTLSRGFYKAVGVTGSLTGTPADIAIIDDPVKDKIEAYSDTYRQRVWDWYTDVLSTRLHNGSKQLLIMTRWHEDDLAGKILKKEPGEWEVLSIPAIKEDEPSPEDPRKPGEALWEERHSLERLRAMERKSLRTFTALYQQHPSVAGGTIWKRDWFRKISVPEFLGIKNKDVIIHFFVDTAYTKNTGNDPSGQIAACRIGNYMYITDAISVYKNFPELIRWIPEYEKAHGYTKSSTIRIEPKANGISVVDQLQDQTDLNVVKTPSPVDSKEVRAQANSAKIECGRVFLVEGEWNENYLEQVTKFPAVAHDEWVDVTNYAIDYLINDEVEIPDDIEDRLPVLDI
jgi:predicted phage terminase large subunit-like protein|nr:MAG TPA: Large Terminase [Caudoviricetes sp.]